MEQKLVSYLFVVFFFTLGYGQTGPYKNRGGYDVIAAAVGGLLSITGQPVIKFFINKNLIFIYEYCD